MRRIYFNFYFIFIERDRYFKYKMAFTSSNTRETTLYLTPPVIATQAGPGTYEAKETRKIKGGGAASVPVDRERAKYLTSQRAPFGNSVDL